MSPRTKHKTLNRIGIGNHSPPEKPFLKGSQNRNAKLNEEMVIFIRSNPDLSLGKLAKGLKDQFGVDISTASIWYARGHITWKHVQCDSPWRRY